MIERLYADGIEAGIQRQLRNPDPAPEVSFSAWSAISSLGTGPASAGLERAGSISDILSGFGTALAASGGSGQGMFSTPTKEEAKQEAEARERMLKSEAFDTRAGNVLRRKAEDLAGNPETTHQANQVIHGLTRGVSKAVVDVMTMGPVVGPLAFGADEGNTSAQRLMEQGVDPATAAKVGVVTAGVQAASVALPAVGPTVGKTIGLAIAGGPASFIAQEAATREILQRADYGDLAAQHDPLDPLGLTLSTIIPLAVGGARIRSLTKRPTPTGPTTIADVVQHIESGGRRYDSDGNLLTSPKGAQGEMQVMPGTATDPGFGVTPAKDNSPEELARVGREYLAAMQQKYGGETDKALAAYNAGPGAVDKVIAKHGDKWLEHLPQETRDYVAKANKLMAEHAVSKGAEDPAVVDAARVRVTDEAMARSLPDIPEAAAHVMRATDDVGAGRMPDVPPVRDIDLPTFREWFGESRVVDEQGAPMVVYHGTARDFDAFADPYEMQLGQNFGRKDFWHYFTPSADDAANYARNAAEKAKTGLLSDAELPGPNIVPAYVKVENPLEVRPPADWETPFGDGGLGYFDLTRKQQRQAYLDGMHDGIIVRNKDGSVAAVATEYDFAVKSAIGNSGKFDPNSPSLTDPLKPGEASPREMARATSSNSLPPAERVGLAAEAPAAKADGSSVKADDGGAVDPARIKQLLDDQPDMKVRLPGTDETVSVGEAMARAREAYDDEVSVAELVKVAAECALMNGF